MPLPKATPVRIIGAGIAGLATAYAAQRRKMPYCMYDASAAVGGSARTYERTIEGETFRYELSPHRFQRVYPAVTALVEELLGDDWQRTTRQNQILYKGEWLNYPLEPQRVARQMGGLAALKAGAAMIRDRLTRRSPVAEDLERWAIQQFGEALSRDLLFPYTEKLWGVAPERLSVQAADVRLMGFSLRKFLAEGWLGVKAPHPTRDEIWYPRLGYGMLASAFAERLDPAALRLDTRVERIETQGKRIVAITANGRREKVSELVSTIPMRKLLPLFEPALPARIRSAAAQLPYRQLLVVALYLNVPQVSPHASRYVPSLEWPFARITEPKNWSADLSPAQSTMLVVEIPCSTDDEWWQLPERQVTQRVSAMLASLGLIFIADLIGAEVWHIKDAYPVPTADDEAAAEAVWAYLEGFENLHLIGHGGKLAYKQVHEWIQDAESLVEKM